MTHHHLPSGHVCSVGLVKGLGYGRRNRPRIPASGVCSQSECGLLPSLWRCVSLCPIFCHKSIGGRSSSRWRAERSTSSRRRGTASRRSGRNARRAGWRVARFVNLAHLARQSLFSLCSTQESGWLRPRRRELQDVCVTCFVHVVAHVFALCFSCPTTCHESTEGGPWR